VVSGAAVPAPSPPQGPARGSSDTAESQSGPSTGVPVLQGQDHEQESQVPSCPAPCPQPCACRSVDTSPRLLGGGVVLPRTPVERPRLSAPQSSVQGCRDSGDCFRRGLGNCRLSLSQTQMSPATNGPSTCCPWTKTSSAWSCPSSFATTSWSVGRCGRDAALRGRSLSLARLLGSGQKSFFRRADA